MSTGTLRLKKLQHTNGTDVATLDSAGAMNLSTIKSSTSNTAMTIDTAGHGSTISMMKLLTAGNDVCIMFRETSYTYPNTGVDYFRFSITHIG